MTHQYQSGRHRYWTISLPQNNMEAVCLPKFRKGVGHTEAIEADKNENSLSLITCCVIPKFLIFFSSRHPCMILGIASIANRPMEEDSLRHSFPSCHPLLPPSWNPGRKKSAFHVYKFQCHLHFVEMDGSQLGDNETCIGLLVIQTKIQYSRRSYSIWLSCTLCQR